MTFTHELCEERREDKERGERIGQLLPGNRCKHRKRRKVAPAAAGHLTSQQSLTQHTRCILINQKGLLCWGLPCHLHNEAGSLLQSPFMCSFLHNYILSDTHKMSYTDKHRGYTVYSCWKKRELYPCWVFSASPGGQQSWNKKNILSFYTGNIT